MINKLRLTGIAVALLLITILAACGSEDENTAKKSSNDTDGKTKDEVKEITIGMDPYDYTKLPTYLSKLILEDNGYKVDVEVADLGILYSALANGEVDVFPDVWEPNLHSTYIDKYEDDMDLVGPLYEESPLGVGVPKYMENVNSIEDLNKYQDKFGGEIYGIEAGTGMNLGMPKMFDAYDMDYTLIESSTEGMLAQVGHKTAKEEPIAFAAWRPHIMFEEYDIKLLDDPKGVWNFDTVHVGVSPDLKEKSSTAYTLFSNMHFTNKEVEEWMVLLRDTDKDVEKEARNWIDEHPDRVKEWLNP